jgi:hypothetical protein
LTVPAHTIFRIAPGVVVKTWDDEELALAYSLGQGKTHLISADGALVLQKAASVAVDFEGLMSLYSPDCGQDKSLESSGPQAEEHLNSTLNGLIRAGLLESLA